MDSPPLMNTLMSSWAKQRLIAVQSPARHADMAVEVSTAERIRL